MKVLTSAIRFGINCYTDCNVSKDFSASTFRLIQVFLDYNKDGGLNMVLLCVGTSTTKYTVSHTAISFLLTSFTCTAVNTLSKLSVVYNRNVSDCVNKICTLHSTHFAVYCTYLANLFVTNLFYRTQFFVII